MKIDALFLAALLFMGALGALSNAPAADGVLLKQEFTPGSYCHEKFPAIGQSTLNDDQPGLKNSGTGDVIDFYGSCDESPVGKDQVQEQELEAQHRWAQDYED